MFDDKKYLVEQILCCLEAEKIRATYGAVGEMIGVIPRGVPDYLGDRRPKASWVVSKKTKLPTGYLEHQMHPDLCSREDIIDNGDDLQKLVSGYHRGRKRCFLGVIQELVERAISIPQRRGRSGTEHRDRIQRDVLREDLVSEDKKILVEKILHCLNAEQIRATYGAVGKIIEEHPRNVRNFLGKRRPEASWVVLKENGHPAGYGRDEKHEKLYSNTRIIQTGAELDELLQKHSE